MQQYGMQHFFSFSCWSSSIVLHINQWIMWGSFVMWIHYTWFHYWSSKLEWRHIHSKGKNIFDGMRMCEGSPFCLLQHKLIIIDKTVLMWYRCWWCGCTVIYCSDIEWVLHYFSRYSICDDNTHVSLWVWSHSVQNFYIVMNDSGLCRQTYNSRLLTVVDGKLRNLSIHVN
jgi:hypothetical protein